MRRPRAICATVAALLLAFLAVAGCGGGTSTTTTIRGSVTFSLKYPAGGTFTASGAITDSGSSTDDLPAQLASAIGPLHSVAPGAKHARPVKGTYTRTLVGKHGTIVFAVTATFAGGRGDAGAWVISSATGRYARLHGSGNVNDIGGIPPNSGTMIGQLTAG